MPPQSANGTNGLSGPETLPSFSLAVPEEPAASWVLDWRADGAEVGEDPNDLGIFELDSLPGEVKAWSLEDL